MIKLCEYICTNPLSGRTNQYIETGIYPTTATTMRIKFQGKGLSAYGKILGFSFSSEEPVWKSASDSTDYRFSNYDINYRRILFDYNNQRIDLSNQPYFDDGYDSDLTFGNYYIYDNDLGVNIGTGTTQTTQATTTIPIMVNVSTIWLKSLEIWQGETKVFDGKAAYDDSTNNIGLYDSISNSLVYNQNLTMTKGADIHTLKTEPSSIQFEASGGTASFTVTAETGWTCTTPSAFTLSTTAGTSGDTVVTVTAANYTGSTRIDEDITLTDDDGYTASVHLRQKPLSTGVQSNIYLGNTNIEVLKLGDKAVESIFLGDVQVYANAPFAGLKITPSTLALNSVTTAKTLSIKSSEGWQLSTDANWIDFSVSSGDSGKSVVTVMANSAATSGDSALTATISAVSVNYSATVSVSYEPTDPNIKDWCRLNGTSAGTGYIISSVDDEIEYKYAVFNGGQSSWGVFISDLLSGNYDSANIHLSRTFSNERMRVSDYGMTTELGLSTGVVYTYIASKTGATLNGSALTLSGTASLKSQGQITINGQSEGWGAIYLEFRELIITNNGVEKLHIVPYLNNGTTACLKDLVSGNIINATIADIGNDSLN